MHRGDRRRLTLLLLVAGPSLAVATLVVGLLESTVGVPNASAVYLVAVVVTAFLTGTAGAIGTAIASFLLYNFLFTQPRYTFTVADPGVWLNVLLLLFVGIVVGQLAALQRSRAEVAQVREREARALFQLSRGLAVRESTIEALADITRILQAQAAMLRVWIALGPDDAGERMAADTAAGENRPSPGVLSVLRRMPGDQPAEWIRVHLPLARGRSAQGVETYRVRIEAGGAVLGSIWATRNRERGLPDQTETRLLAAAADQVGQAIAHDRLAAEARASEVARQSDALKSALLQSVSHDFRTPLATIRAAAGMLRPGSRLTTEEQLESAEAIDREVEYLNRLVTNLLDLSRIEAGALRAEKDAFELEDVLAPTLERLGPRMTDRPLEVALDAPPVEVDPVFLDQAFTNVLENALKHTPPQTGLRIGAAPVDGLIRLTIEDAGPGVPAEALPRLFEKFYRAPGGLQGSRSGTGIGLAVARGLVEAMGGRVHARRSEIGGLAIDLDLPPAPPAAPASRSQ